MLKTYSRRIADVHLAGPTSFAPCVRKAVELVKAAKARELTICLIIADGPPGPSASARAETEAALVEASKLPIVFVIVGVGDGPWAGMEKLDDAVAGRKFDNVNFVLFSSIAAKAAEQKVGFAGALAMECLSELPQAFKDCTRLNMFGKKW